MTKASGEITLYYLHDPMCSWCWGFRPTWQKLIRQLPSTVKPVYVLGGLAPDTDNPMPEQMQLNIQDTWKQIQHDIPGTRFNFDFWSQCTPRRSTYPACRAILAARKQNPSADLKMLLAIQQCYYLEARNPSDADVLIDLASNIKLDVNQFKQDLVSDEINQQLLKELELCQRLEVNSFPGLVLQVFNKNHHIHIDYVNCNSMLKQISALT